MTKFKYDICPDDRQDSSRHGMCASASDGNGRPSDETANSAENTSPVRVAFSCDIEPSDTAAKLTRNTPPILHPVPDKQTEEPKSDGGGLLSALLAFIMSSESSTKHNTKHNGKCNGDCANCPPHYGYRYGRWYYGHGHVDGCEFGGNGNDRCCGMD